MAIHLSEESKDALAEYAGVSIAFRVDRVLDIAQDAVRRDEFALVERGVEVAYVKDYDAVAGDRPTEWGRRFDLSNWGFIAAGIDGRRVGGAAIAFDTPGVAMLEGRNDLAVLWDIRVSPEARGHGVGSALFRAAEVWAVGRGCRELKVETQNINVPACRFYARQGCVLRGIDRMAYPEHPQEVQMIWRKNLIVAKKTPR